jgi:hypothetical protein
MMEEGYYDDLCEALHNLADELDNARIPQQPTHTEVKRQVRTLAKQLRELAGIDTRAEREHRAVLIQNPPV